MALKTGGNAKHCFAYTTMLAFFLTSCAHTQPSTNEKNLNIALPPSAQVQTQIVEYHCSGSPNLLSRYSMSSVKVQYINAGAIHLAVLVVDNETRVLANVIAASGAKYVADEFVWWTKGNLASLTTIQHTEAGTLTCVHNEGGVTEP